MKFKYLNNNKFSLTNKTLYHTVIYLICVIVLLLGCYIMNAEAIGQLLPIDVKYFYTNSIFTRLLIGFQVLKEFMFTRAGLYLLLGLSIGVLILPLSILAIQIISKKRPLSGVGALNYFIPLIICFLCRYEYIESQLRINYIAKNPEICSVYFKQVNAPKSLVILTNQSPNYYELVLTESQIMIVMQNMPPVQWGIFDESQKQLLSDLCQVNLNLKSN